MGSKGGSVACGRYGVAGIACVLAAFLFRPSALQGEGVPAASSQGLEFVSLTKELLTVNDFGLTYWALRCTWRSNLPGIYAAHSYLENPVGSPAVEDREDLYNAGQASQELVTAISPPSTARTVRVYLVPETKERLYDLRTVADYGVAGASAHMEIEIGPVARPDRGVEWTSNVSDPRVTVSGCTEPWTWGARGSMTVRCTPPSDIRWGGVEIYAKRPGPIWQYLGRLQGTSSAVFGIDCPVTMEVWDVFFRSFDVDGNTNTLNETDEGVPTPRVRAVIGGRGHLSVSPLALRFAGSANTGIPSQWLSIVAEPNEQPRWTIQTVTEGRRASWVNANPAEGTGTRSVEVSVSSDRMTPGRYTASLVVTNHASGEQTAVSVTLDLYPGAAVVSPGGVGNAASFLPPIAPGSWVTVAGTNLADTARSWTALDFRGDQLPTVLDGISVMFDGEPGFVSYVSGTQINVLAPDSLGTPAARVEVINSRGTSPAVSVPAQTAAPAFFLFAAGGYQYVAAVHPDGAYVGRPDLIPGAACRPAEPGEIILLFGNGFGPTDPPAPSGILLKQPAVLASPVRVWIGGQEVNDVLFAGLVSPGLYQFNVRVPETGAGDQQVIAEIAGHRTPAGPLVTVR